MEVTSTMVAAFKWADNERPAERTVNSVSVTSEFNRGAWVDLALDASVPGLVPGANVTLRRSAVGEDAFDLPLVVVGPFRTANGGWSIRTIPKYHQAARPADGGLRVLCAARDVGDTIDFIKAMARELGIVLHTDDMSRIDLEKLGALAPCGGCLPVPACQLAEAAFGELLSAIGHETQAVTGWTRIVGAEGYVLVGRPAGVPELSLDDWAWTVALSERCHDRRLIAFGAKRLEKVWQERDLQHLFDVLFGADELFRYEREKQIPLAPASVSVDGEPHLVVAARTTVTVMSWGEQSEGTTRVELDLVDCAYGLPEPFVPRTCTLVGELSSQGSSPWLDGRSVAITAPNGDAASELPPRLANWTAIECRAADSESDDADHVLPGYVAAPFTPRDGGGDIAMYDPWRQGDLVVFRASTFQPLVVLGAYGRQMAEFEGTDDVWMNMRGKYRITGPVEITGRLDVHE